MNQDQLEGKWKELKGSIKEKWGKLTNDHLDEINGKQEKLIGRIQHEYGVSKEEAQDQVKLFMNDLSKDKTH